MRWRTGSRRGRGIRSADVADTVVYMLTRPQHVNMRDLVILPVNQESELAPCGQRPLAFHRTLDDYNAPSSARLAVAYQLDERHFIPHELISRPPQLG
jgi:hypothetical protein